MRLVGVALEHHVAAGVVGPIGEIDRLEVMGLVPRIDVAEFQRGHDLAGRVHQGHFLARLEPGGQLRGHRQGDRNRPGVELALVLDDRLFQHAMIGLRIHRAGQRAQTAVAQAIDGREIGVGNRNLGQGLGVGEKTRNLIGRNGAANRFGETTMNRHKSRHKNP